MKVRVLTARYHKKNANYIGAVEHCADIHYVIYDDDGNSEIIG